MENSQPKGRMQYSFTIHLKISRAKKEWERMNETYLWSFCDRRLPPFRFSLFSLLLVFFFRFLVRFSYLGHLPPSSSLHTLGSASTYFCATNRKYFYAMNWKTKNLSKCDHGFVLRVYSCFRPTRLQYINYSRFCLRPWYILPFRLSLNHYKWWHLFPICGFF